MINVIDFSDKSFESEYIPVIDEAYQNAALLLDKLPKSIDIKFTDNGGSDDSGVGGFCYSNKQINVAIIKNYHDKTLQQKNLYSTILHESFHLQQGFTYEDSPFTALGSAIYEGCAVIFERVYAQNQTAYGDYSQFTEQQLQNWLDEIETVGTEYFENVDVWHKWAFYHPDYNQKWIVYKVGTWLVDRILQENNLDILDLKNKTADEIITLKKF